MSRSLTAAARRRYAPNAVCVLWSRVGSSTSAERFVEAVAGRWERSAAELEEELRARTPAVRWSERSGRSPRPPRRRRVHRAGGAPRPWDERMEPPADPDQVPASSRRPADTDMECEPVSEAESATRAAVPRSRVASRSRTESRLSAAPAPGGEDPDRSPPAAVARSGGAGALVFPDGSGRPAPLAAGESDPGGESGRSTGHSVPRLPRRVGRPENTAPPRSRRAATARRVFPGKMDAIDPAAGTPARPGDLDRLADLVDDTDEAARRRFDAWSLERGWREEALEEWRESEF